MLRNKSIFEMAEALTISEERSKPPKGYPTDPDLYAVEDEWLFPLDNEKHVHAAITMFNKHHFKSEAQRKKAAKKILRYAKKYDIGVNEDDDVYKAAHAK